MSKITPQSFSRNAENQLAATLEQKVERFRKSKVKRLEQATDIWKWASELLVLVQKLSTEPVLPSPVPPLAPASERKQLLTEWHVLQWGNMVLAGDEYQFGGNWAPVEAAGFLGHTITEQEEQMSNFRRRKQ